jgi:hypothetical protein
VSLVGQFRWGLIVLVGLAAGVRQGWAESAPAPACYRPPTVQPAGGAVVPANLPAFAFRPAEYSGTRAPRDIGWHQIELRGDAGTPLAITTEAGEAGTYLIRPQQALPAGQLTFSFIDDCPSYYATYLLDPPVRNDRTTFRVAPASALPTELGAAMLRSVSYESVYACGPPAFASVVVEVEPSAGALAFHPALTLDVRADSAPYLRSGVTFDEARSVFRIDMQGRCFEGTGQELVRGMNAVEIHARLLGSTAIIAAARLSIDLDCAAGTDAGVVVCLDASTPPEPSGSGAPDADLDASPGGQPAGAGGCGCRSGREPVAGGLLWAGLLAGVLARAGGRRRRL